MFLKKKNPTIERPLLKTPLTLKDLEHCSDAASKDKRQWKSASWKVDGQIYTVSTIYSEVLATFVWKLCAGELDETLIWQHQSRDLSYVFNLVVTHTSNIKPKVHRLQPTLHVVDEPLSPAAQSKLTPASQAWWTPSLNAKVGQAQKPVLFDYDGSAQMSSQKSPRKLPELIRSEDGLLTYPAFLLLLEREYHRSNRAKSPLAVATFSFDQSNDLAQSEANNQRRRFENDLLKLKRKSDTLAKFKEGQYALLLPNTALTGAKIASRRLLKALESSFPRSLSFGVADVFADGINLDSVLIAAQKAQAAAKQSGAKTLSYRDLVIIGLCEERLSQSDKAAEFDKVSDSVIEELKKGLTSTDTGVFVRPVLDLFLEYDYLRALREKRSVSVLRLRLEMDSSVSPPLPYAPLTIEVLQYVAKIKRKTDILAEFDKGDFALLLPDTVLAGAEILATRIKTVLERELSLVLDQSIPFKVELSVADALPNYPELDFQKVEIPAIV